MALLDNGVQINTIMPKYVSDHLLQMGPITNLLGANVVGKCLHDTFGLCHYPGSSRESSGL